MERLLEPFDPSLAFFLLLGASLIYAGGCTLNDAFDQKFDARYNPDRPIPSGKISLNAARMLGSLELVVGSWLMISLAVRNWMDRFSGRVHHNLQCNS